MHRVSPTRILLRAPKDPFRVASAEETLTHDLIGTNSGNLLFSTAAARLLSVRDALVLPERFNVTPDEADAINERYDHFVVPLANAFRPDFLPHLERLSATVERLRIPVTIMGVGAQAPGEGDRASLRPLDAAVSRLCRAVLDRSASIGVRGEFTAQYLHDLGFSDVEVIGCPSILLRDEPVEIRREQATLAPDARLAVNLTPEVNGIRDFAAHHARDFRNSRYIAQDWRDLRLMLRTDHERRGSRTRLAQRIGDPYFTPSRARLYLDPATWINELTAFDFAVGTRIHGNIAAVLAGRPAFVLAHDSRTLELARALDLPHQAVRDVATLRAEELYAHADYHAFNAGRARRIARMTSFLARNGLHHIYEPGESGASFDARMATLHLPPAVRPHSSLTTRLASLRSWLGGQTRQSGEGDPLTLR
jgi:hypothetical protein